MATDFLQNAPVQASISLTPALFYPKFTYRLFFIEFFYEKNQRLDMVSNTIYSIALPVPQWEF